MIHVRLDRLRAGQAREDRMCGECTACCTVMAVPAKRKPNRHACEHVKACGCEIHSERPDECRLFHCLWLRGAIEGGEPTRPDVLGVMFDQFTVHNPPGESQVHTLAFELWDGALESTEARAVIDELAQRFGLAVSYRDGRWSEVEPG
ncbi:MAG: hypothetical protein Q8Q09_06420 [Deltaproteobacteria bacterium]|nr:hypothetical protein [Deltaproteobacteria bacterium]